MSQWAARILDRYPDASTNLIKALLCHFVNPAVVPSAAALVPSVIGGFGEPEINSCLSSPFGSVTYVHEGSITTDDYQYIQFHIPASLAPQGAQPRLKVRGTLVYNPQVNPDNALEYSQARMLLTLIKSTNGGWRDVSLPSSYPSYRVPWSPVLRFEKSFTRAYATGIWEARARLMTRGALVEGFVQDYALVIEVVDPSGTRDLYHEIESQYGGIYASSARRAA